MNYEKKVQQLWLLKKRLCLLYEVHIGSVAALIHMKKVSVRDCPNQ